MNLTLVNSAAIAEVGVEEGILAVRFHGSDTAYCHPGVPYEAFREFMPASSMGAYYNPLHNRHIAELFGGGEYGERMAEPLHRIKFDLPLDGLLEKTAPGRPDPAQPNSVESSLIQANPG